MHQLNALASFVLPGLIAPKQMNLSFASTTVWTLTPHRWQCPLKQCAVLSTFFGLWMQHNQPSIAPTHPWNIPKAQDFLFHLAAQRSGSSEDQGTSIANKLLNASMNGLILACATLQRWVLEEWAHHYKPVDAHLLSQEVMQLLRVFQRIPQSCDNVKGRHRQPVWEQHVHPNSSRGIAVYPLAGTWSS